ncbi:MAG: complex I NDUFA9 subunit family protein [Armatimonadota bacterium]
MRIFLTGASGFIGTHMRRALVRNGHQVVGLARRPQAEEEGVTWLEGDVNDQETLIDGMSGCGAVVHLVGIITEHGEETYRRVHVQGTEHVLAAMRRAKVHRLLHMSALGAGARQPTEYFRTKWAAEELVRASAIDYTIFRPSTIFGPGDGFVNTLVDQIRRFPMIPIIGSGKYPIAPISIHAVVEAYSQALSLNGPTQAKTFELCGPEVLTYTQIVRLLATHMRVSKARVHLPVGLVRFGINLLHFLRIPSPITQDQLTMLLLGSTCADQSAVQVFDLPRITLAEGIRDYVRPGRE